MIRQFEAVMQSKVQPLKKGKKVKAKKEVAKKKKKNVKTAKIDFISEYNPDVYLTNLDKSGVKPKAKKPVKKLNKSVMHKSVSPVKRKNKILFDASDKQLDSLFDT